MKQKASKTQLAVLSVLAGVVYLVTLVLPLKDGWEGGKKSVAINYESAIDNDGSHIDMLRYDSWSVRLKPKKDKGYYPDSVFNTKSQTLIPVEHTEMHVKSERPKGIALGWILWEFATFLIVLAGLIAFFTVPFLFYKLIVSFYRNNIFDSDNVRRIRKIGILYIVFYFSMLEFSAFYYFSAKNAVALEDYDIVYPDINPEALLIGIILLIISLVMNQALKLKEEQELTI